MSKNQNLLKSNQIFCGHYKIIRKLKALKIKCKRDTRCNIYHKFNVTVIVNLAPMWFSSSVFLEQTEWSSDVIRDLFYRFCRENYCTEAASCLFFFSWVYKNEIEMGMRIKLSGTTRTFNNYATKIQSRVETVVFLAGLDYNYVEIFVILQNPVYGSLSNRFWKRAVWTGSKLQGGKQSNSNEERNKLNKLFEVWPTIQLAMKIFGARY